MNAYSPITPEMIQEDMRYLQLLSRSFPNIAAASSEIINLEAIVNLPKGTEHFLADLHGEYEAFQHVLRNASGAIKRKVKELFGDSLSDVERKELCTLIYYPEQKLHLVKAVEKDLDLEQTSGLMPKRFIEIYALKSKTSPSKGVLLHHSGIVARKYHSA